MAKLWKAGCWLGALTGAWLTVPSVQAGCDYCPPEMRVGDILKPLCNCHGAHMQNLAPWYMYFPVQSACMEPSASAMYPTWPSSFPPPQPSPAWQHAMPTSGYAPGVQPVSIFRTSMPSYWFAR
jgi:hypothetical protein